MSKKWRQNVTFRRKCEHALLIKFETKLVCLQATIYALSNIKQGLLCSGMRQDCTASIYIMTYQTLKSLNFT